MPVLPSMRLNYIMTTKVAMSTYKKPCSASSAAGQAILAGVELRGRIPSYHKFLRGGHGFCEVILSINYRKRDRRLMWL